MVIGIDHGFYAIKGAHVVFPSGLTVYDYEPYTTRNVLQYEGKYYVCGTGRQALLKGETGIPEIFPEERTPSGISV